MNKNKKVLYILLCVLIVILLGLFGTMGFFLIDNHTKNIKEYENQLRLADQSLKEEAFEEAIVAYSNAIEEAPEKEEGYLGLAQVYIAQNMEEDARAILRKGYLKTGSEDISSMLRKLSSLLVKKGETSQELQDVAMSQEELEKASQKVVLNYSLLQKIYNYTYSEFNREFGSPDSKEMQSDDILVLTYEEGFACYYQNTDTHSQIVDTLHGEPYDDAMPFKVILTSIRSLFKNFAGGVTADKLNLMIGQKATATKYEDKNIIEFHLDDCILRFETDKNGNIVDGSWNEIELLNANKNKKEEKKYGELIGTILDATSGEGVEEAKIYLSGEGGSSEMKTDKNGGFSAELTPGSYELTIEAEGYQEESFSVNVQENSSQVRQFALSPKIAEGEVRIVLEWESNPYDLDSHLIGETDENREIHIYFGNRYENSGKSRSKIAELDVDERSGYGPETITVYDLNGIYEFYVKDFHHTGTMGKSDVKVKVYMAQESQPIIYEIPDDVENEWKVFTLDHGSLR